MPVLTGYHADHFFLQVAPALLTGVTINLSGYFLSSQSGYNETYP